MHQTFVYNQTPDRPRMGQLLVLVLFLDLCIHAGVIFEFVYSCWCRFGIGVLMLVSVWDLCIPVNVPLGFVYSCWYQSFSQHAKF